MLATGHFRSLLVRRDPAFGACGGNAFKRRLLAMRRPFALRTSQIAGKLFPGITAIAYRLDRVGKTLAKMSILNDHNAMTKTVAKAKEQFCELVELANQGKSTTITRHNKPVACVVPAERDSRRLTDQWRRRVVNVRLNRKGQQRLTVSQLIQEGRK
jgi:prevent-host-death family protein